MKNVINYYYQFNIYNIYQVDGNYYFEYMNKKYMLKIYDKDIDNLNRLYILNNILIKDNNYYHKIILNINNLPYIIINNKIYVLLELSNLINDKISIYDLNYNYIDINKELSGLIKSDWYNLWISNIDYLEYKMEHMDNSLLLSIYNFFIGLSENAVSYINNSSNKIKNNSDNLVISHRRININMTLIDYYSPLDLIIDHKTRDISEYIKSCIINDMFDYNLINDYLNYCNLSEYGYSLLMGRILYPSFFYDNLDNYNYLYEFNIDKYILYLKDIYFIIKSKSNIDLINWLEK